MKDAGFLDDICCDDDEEVWVFTPWGCLYSVLKDYGVDVSHITGTIGEHLVKDFMDRMIRAGHIAKNEESEC